MYSPLFVTLMGIGTAKAPILKACRRDQRFSYFLYLPKGFQEESASEYMITVVVHGTTRNAEKLKNVFAEWIENGHFDFTDEHTIILRIELTSGLLLSHGTKYKF